MKKIVIIILAIALVIFWAEGIKAQAFPTALSLEISPTTPLPNSRATISATLSGSDTTGAVYTWFLNNVKQSDSSGQDKNTFSFPVGNLGSVYTVAINIKTQSGESLKDSISFTVGDVDITWASANLAPAYYEAKILPSRGSRLTISALPIVFVPGTKILLNSNNLTYHWSLNNIPDTNSSGLGKSNFQFNIDNSANVRVQVSNSQNTVMVEKSITIPVVEPKLLIFASDQTGNILYNRIVTALSTNLGKSVSFKAVPYFFNLLPAQLNWSWFANDQKVSGAAQQPWIITLNIPADLASPADFQTTVNAVNPYSASESATSLVNITAR